MVKITNYMEQAIDFAKIDTPEFKRCIKYIKSMEKDPESLFPPIKHKVSFELHDTNTELANGFRKCILDELSIKSMTFDDNDWASDDRYILSDFLKTNLESIPINQNENYTSLHLSLYKNNTSEDVINVYSHDINVEKSNNTLKSIDYFASNVVIIQLQPGKYIKISNIKIAEGFTYKNANKFAAVSATEYEILDMEPLLQEKYKTSGKSSLLSNPSKFKLSYTTYGNIKPNMILEMCCQTLRKRAQLIWDELEQVDTKKSPLSYVSDKIKIETRDMLYVYIEEESWSLGRWIAKKCYIEYENIPIVTTGIVHPSLNKCYIKIKHSQSIDILKKAVKSIINDISKIEQFIVGKSK